MDIRAGSKLTGPNGLELTIEKGIGHGAVGQVFKATAAGRNYAVKTLLTGGLDERELAALQNEARLGVGIVHPNVVFVESFFDGEDDQGFPPYLVMEYVEGETLYDQIERHRAMGTSFTIDELVVMYLQIADGMVAVSARVVHRDMKPQNILVDTKLSRLKIVDFGTAKALGAATRSKTFKGHGTPQYMSPEAFNYDKHDTPMDVYSAGVMFFEMATLKLPCPRAQGDLGLLAWYNAHLRPAVRPTSLRDDIPPALEQIIMRMLQKDPNQRPATWQAVVDDLKRMSPADGRPDVTALLKKSASTFAETSALEAAKLVATQKEQARVQSLKTAFEDVCRLLTEHVDAFNGQSSAGRLTLRRETVLEIEVFSDQGRRLRVVCVPIDDLPTTQGRFRLVGVAHVEPRPSLPAGKEAAQISESIESFNVAYRVRAEDDLFGEWSLSRFEDSGLSPTMRYPHWFGVAVPGPFVEQLTRGNVVGGTQRQDRALDATWFVQLLEHLL